MMNKIKFNSVVFDLDGTLIDSLPDVLAALNNTLKHYDYAKISLSDLRKLVGKGAVYMVENAFLVSGKKPRSETIKEAVGLYLDFYRAEPANHTIVYPGVVECLESLKDLNVRMGICSNKPYEMIQLVLKELGLDQFFSAMTCGDSVPKPKPSGDHIKFTLNLMKADLSHNAIMIGDSEVDLLAARDAKIPIVLVNYGYSTKQLENLQADYVIGNLNLLPNLVSFD